MLLGTDELTILKGSKFYGTWQWINYVTSEPEDFAGLSASIKIKNIHEDFADVKNTYEVGTAIVEPLDIDGNPIKGRVDIDLSKTDTLHFQIPEGEDDRYGESDFYSILSITLSTGEVILQAQVRVVESLESETLNFLIDERDEAIIINGKLDNILLRNNEFISTRDNLIDVVIPNAISTYNTNHNEKLGIYNTNHTDKINIYNTNDTSKTDTYNSNHQTKLQEVNTLALTVQSDKEIIEQAKANVLTMKDNVQGNKESVEAMKIAVEAMLDSFDDRYLGRKESDPLVDNDGNPLEIGAIYYSNLDKALKFYNGVSWDSPVAAAQTYALQASQSASSALASKNAAKISEDNAKASEQNTQTLAGQVANNYEPKNANIQSHISNSTNPHGTTAAQVGAYSTSETDAKLNLKIDIANIIDNLTSTLTNKPLSANQGKILKGYIDSINTLLLSDDTSLDTLQEIVAYIKANKNNLDALADIHSKTAKTTLVDADEFMTADSTSTWSLKKITWASIKTALTSLFTPRVATTTNKAIARYNGTNGNLQNSTITIDDSGNIGSGLQSFNGFGGTGGFKNKFINSTKIVNIRRTNNKDNSYNYDMHYKVGNNWFRPIEGINIRSNKPHTISWDGSATCSYYIGNATSLTINNQAFTAIAKGETITPVIPAGQNIWFKFSSDETGSTYLNEQFEEGTIPTPFEYRPYGLELSLSQRYFENIDTYRYNTTIYGTGTGFEGLVRYKVQKRIAPSVSFGTPSHWRTLNINNGFSLSSLSVSEVTEHSFYIVGTSSLGNIVAGYCGRVQVGDGYIDNGVDGLFVSADL